MEILNDVLGYKNTKIIQDSEMFNFTLDSVFLARFVSFRQRDKKILDIGTNNGIIPIILTKYFKGTIDAIDIQQPAIDLSLKNLKLNNIENQVNLILKDINEYKVANENKYDVVVCNPPFYKKGEAKLSNNEAVEIARQEKYLTLKQLVQKAKSLLNNKGYFYIVLRASRLQELMVLFNENNFGVQKLKFIYPKITKPANSVLVEARLLSNSNIVVEKPLITHNEDNTYTKEAQKYFED